MDSGVRILIRLSFIAVFFVIRTIYKNNNSSKTKEIAIRSTLTVEEGISNSLQLRPGELVSLLCKPGTFEVLVKAKGSSQMYESIGIIEDRELYDRVNNNTVRGTIYYIEGNQVTIDLTY